MRCNVVSYLREYEGNSSADGLGPVKYRLLGHEQHFNPCMHHQVWMYQQTKNKVNFCVIPRAPSIATPGSCFAGGV